MASKNLDGVLVKKAHVAQQWTQAQIEELLKCSDPATGPNYFLNNFFYIQHPTKGKIKYAAYPYQEELLNSYHENRFSINMLGRQLGKCLCENTTVSVRHSENSVIYDIPIGILYKYEYAKKHGLELPDLSKYERKNL